jgi:hypothetical protein
VPEKPLKVVGRGDFLAREALPPPLPHIPPVPNDTVLPPADVFAPEGGESGGGGAVADLLRLLGGHREEDAVAVAEHLLERRA